MSGFCTLKRLSPPKMLFEIKVITSDIIIVLHKAVFFAHKHPTKHVSELSYVKMFCFSTVRLEGTLGIFLSVSTDFYLVLWSRTLKIHRFILSIKKYCVVAVLTLHLAVFSDSFCAPSKVRHSVLCHACRRGPSGPVRRHPVGRRRLGPDRKGAPGQGGQRQIHSQGHGHRREVRGCSGGGRPRAGRQRQQSGVRAGERLTPPFHRTYPPVVNSSLSETLQPADLAK